MKKTDERDIAAGVRARDTESFRRLYDGNVDRVLGFALRLTGNRTEAEDLVQETFAAAYAGLSGFQGRAGPLTWLLGIAARRWRDRRRHQVPATTPLDEDVTLPHLASLEDGVIGDVTLSQALAQLPPPQREALLLVASQGLTYGEAAAALETPVGTVKWRVFEATRRMKALLQAVEEEYDAMQQA